MDPKMADPASGNLSFFRVEYLVFGIFCNA